MTVTGCRSHALTIWVKSTAQSVGKRVRLMGWVARVRNLGGVRFVELRDRYGRVQVVVDAGGEMGDVPPRRCAWKT